MVAASVALLFFWLAVIFAAFGILAWVGDKYETRLERKGHRRG